ncbi:MAG: GNAT family N-acetyltransferase [Planctomycetota bacterium]
MKIRPAKPDDVLTWGDLRHKLWEEHASNELTAELNQFFDGSTGRAMICYMLECEEGDPLPAGTLGGFAEASMRSDAEGCKSSPVGYLEGWYIEPALRWQGWGGKLVHAVEQWAREQGATEMASDHTPENVVSERAHKALGYQVVQRIVCLRKSL